MSNIDFTHTTSTGSHSLASGDIPVFWSKFMDAVGTVEKGDVKVNTSQESAFVFSFNPSKVKDGQLDSTVAKLCIFIQEIYSLLFQLTDKQKDTLIMTRYKDGNQIIIMVCEWGLTLTKKRKVLGELQSFMDSHHVPALANNARYVDLVTSYEPNDEIEVYQHLDPILSKCILKPLFGPNGEYQDNINFYTRLDPLICNEVKLKRNNTAYHKLKVKMDNIDDASKVGYESEMQMVASLCKMLAPHRCMEYQSFMSIGQTIYNSVYGRDEGLAIWQAVAEKSDHVHLCPSKWDDFEMEDDKSVNMLRLWACEDNKESYFKWKNGNINELIRESVKVTGGKGDIANVFYHLNQDRYVCSDYSKNQWYEFNLRWRFVDGAYSVKKAITDELVPRYIEALAQFNRQIQNAETDVEKDRWSKYVDRCTRIIINLKDDGFKNSILKSCAERFYDENFEKNRDKLPHLVGFDDGVFDCNTGRFRAADPRERVTITCGYPMPVAYNWEHPDVKRILQIISMIITNRSIREFWLASVGDLLKSGNRHKRMLISIGPSNSGKSVLENTSEYSLGEEYWVKPPVEQLTYQGETNPDGATASREILKYAKEVNYSEPKAGAKLNDAFIKTGSSGGDGMFSRNLHQGVTRGQTMKIRPGYLPIYNTNYFPKYDGTDASMANRLIPINNNSHFVDTVNNTHGIMVPDTLEEQMKKKIFPMNIHLKDEIKDKKLHQAYMWIRCQYNIMYQDKYIEIPDEVKEYARLMAKRNDPIAEYLNAKVVRGTEDDFIEAESLYASFVAYHKSRFPNDPRNGPSSADIFEEKMIQKGHNLIDNKWTKIKWMNK